MGQHLDKWQLYNIEHKLFPLLLDYLNVNFFAIDKEGFYIYRNSLLTGIVGDTDKAPDDEGWRTCKEVIETGTPQKIEEEQDGKWYLSVKKPLLDGKGNIIGVIGAAIDITDRKKAEKLQKKQQVLQKEILQKSLAFASLMAGSMAHELRNPLSQVGLYIDLVEGTVDSNQPLEEKKATLKTMVATIKKIIKDTTEVISDMLLKVRTFAAGEVPSHTFEELSILADIEDALEKYPFEAGEKDVVEVSLGALFKYRGSKPLTKHLFNNLMKNALHARKESDKTKVCIKIETKSTDKFNQLIFTDTATGVDEAFLKKMFDPFETKKTTKGGTGLGLALCKMIMESYGGSITCESKLGEYTKFTLNFPK